MYVRADGQRFSKVDDVVSRVLGGGVANRWLTRLRPTERWMNDRLSPMAGSARTVRHGLSTLFAGSGSGIAAAPTTADGDCDGDGDGGAAAAAASSALSQSRDPAALVAEIGPPRELHAADLASYRKAFALIDADGSGAIDPDEMLRALESAGLNHVTAADVGSVFSLVDTDGNGEIDVDEYTCASDAAPACGGYSYLW